jgi:hypothetical protein
MRNAKYRIAMLHLSFVAVAQLPMPVQAIKTLLRGRVAPVNIDDT